MNKQKSLLVNTFYQGISNLTNLFFFILLVLAGRYLGSEGYGKFSFALAFISIFAPIIEPGLSPIIVREVSRDKKQTRRYLSNVLGYKVGISLIYYAMPIIILLVFGTSQETLHAVFILAFARIIKTFKAAFTSIVEAYEYFGFHALSAFIERSLILVIGFYVLTQGASLLHLCFVFVAVRIIDLSINIVFVKYYICYFTINFNFTFIKSLLKEALPIGTFTIVLMLYTYIDTVMISIFKGDIETGLYNAAFRLYEGLVIIPGAVGVAFMPRLSNSYKYNRSYFTELVNKGVKYITIISFSIIVSGIMLSENLIILFFGHDYFSSIYALKILLYGILFMFLMNYLNMVLVSINKQKIMLYFAIIGLILNVSLNLIFIPYKGFIGAAIATLIGEGVVFTLLTLYLYKYQKIYIFKMIVKPLGAMVAAFSILKIIVFVHSIYLEVIILNIIYIAFLIFFKVLNKQEIETIFKFGKITNLTKIS
jgi:O-antigen/teichoic acid export membrane protein